MRVPRLIFPIAAPLFRLVRIRAPRLDGDERDYCDGAARHRGGQRWTQDAEIVGFLDRRDREG